MKKVNAFSDGAAGDGWFKIWNYGYENGRFCTDFLRENGGMMSVKIPQDLDGYVLAYYYFKELDVC